MFSLTLERSLKSGGEQGRIQNFMKRRGCFAYVLAIAAKLAHAQYRQASWALRALEAWPVPNPPQVVCMQYVRIVLALLHTYQHTGIISLGPFIYFPCL